jgi:hypothetical protein
LWSSICVYKLWKCWGSNYGGDVNHLCRIISYRRFEILISVQDVLGVLGYDAVKIGTFTDVSGDFLCRFSEYHNYIKNKGSNLLRNVGICMPVDTVSHPRRLHSEFLHILYAKFKHICVDTKQVLKSLWFVVPCIFNLQITNLLWLTNRPRQETRPPWLLYGNRRLRLQFKRAPDDGQNVARNMLSSV